MSAPTEKKTAAAPSAPAEAPLHRTWCVLSTVPTQPAHGTLHRKGGKGRPQDAAPKELGTFGTICGLWQFLNSLPGPSTLVPGANLYIFQDGIAPTWDDPVNANGGRWTYTPYNRQKPADGGQRPPKGADGACGQRPPEDVDRAWLNLVLDLTGETLDQSGEVCGIALLRREDYVRFSIWTRDRSRESALMAVGRRALDSLAEAFGAAADTPESRRRRLALPVLEYQDHEKYRLGKYEYRYTLTE